MQKHVNPSARILLMIDFIIFFPICKLEMQIYFHFRMLNECSLLTLITLSLRETNKQV